MTGRRTKPLFAHTEPQADHNEPGKPWTAHESYELDDASPDDPNGKTVGTRRLGYGATKMEALAIATLNAKRYPIGTDVPHEVTLRWSKPDGSPMER